MVLLQSLALHWAVFLLILNNSLGDSVSGSTCVSSLSNTSISVLIDGEALGAVMALIIFFYYPLSLGEAPDSDHSLKEKILGLGLKSAVILAGALICLFLALQLGGTKHPWSDSRVWGYLVGFGLLLTLFVFIQIRQGEA